MARGWPEGRPARVQLEDFADDVDLALAFMFVFAFGFRFTDLREVRLATRRFGFAALALRTGLRVVFFFPRIAGEILLCVRLVASSSRQPCASRTEIIVCRILFHVSCFIMTAFGNMQPSQQIW